MMRIEFEQLTGIYPSTELYRAIEREYIEQDEDKTVFCEKYKNNTDGLAVKIQQAAWADACEELDRQTRKLAEHEQDVAELEKRVDELNRQIAKLEAKLEKEQEWQPCEMEENVSQADYERLASSGREMSEDEAKQLIWEEFGFDKDKIRIVYSVPGYEINRHGEKRRAAQEIERRPFYAATDWNYVRFNCADWCWEMHNGMLRPFMH